MMEINHYMLKDPLKYWSSLSSEYMFGKEIRLHYTKWNDKEKLHNSEVSDYSDFINLEDDIKKKFGVKFNNTNFETIDRLIDKSVIDFKNRKLEIDEYANKSFYNYDNTVHFFMNNKEILK